jgi:hypothetical protein
LANAQGVFLRSWGTNTCGDALANIQKNQTYKSIYTSYLDGYISHHNWNENTLLTSTISSKTMEQLWIAKCSQVENITKIFPLIANEIIEEAKRKKE